MVKDQDIIDSLKNNDQQVLDEVYRKHKKSFYLFARTFSIPTNDIEDIYQETIISLYENIQNNKLSKLTSSLKTYLFAIGKFKILKQLNKPTFPYSQDNVILVSEEMKVFEAEVNEERQKTLKKSWAQLGDKCQQILELYYYKGKTLDEIQKDLNYSSKDVLKSQKSRCLKQLKELVKKTHE